MADKKKPAPKPRRRPHDRQATSVLTTDEAQRIMAERQIDEDGATPPKDLDEVLSDRKLMYRAMSPLSVRRAGIPSEVARMAVMALRSAGLNIEDISDFLGTTPATLRKYYDNELTIGDHGLLGGIALTMAQSALQGDVKAGMFWLKARGGWNDRPEPKPPEQVDQTDMAEQVKRIVDAVDAIKREAGKLPPPGTPTYEVKS